MYIFGKVEFLTCNSKIQDWVTDAMSKKLLWYKLKTSCDLSASTKNVFPSYLLEELLQIWFRIFLGE